MQALIWTADKIAPSCAFIIMKMLAQFQQVDKKLRGSMHRAAPVNGGAEEDQVGPEHGLDDRQRDGGRLVDHQQLRLRQALVVLREDVLHGLRAKTGSASMTSSSAWARRSWCCGRMYCTVCARARQSRRSLFSLSFHALSHHDRGCCPTQTCKQERGPRWERNDGKSDQTMTGPGVRKETKRKDPSQPGDGHGRR